MQRKEMAADGGSLRDEVREQEPIGPLSAPRPMYAAYVLGLLFLVNVVNVIDRVVVGVLIDPIKKDLLLTDTQLSIISGFAFVAFHLVAGLYVARWVDRGNRRIILAAGVGLWSLATALTGLAQDFHTLVICRFVVGAGEATAFPVAVSLIADFFRPEHRPRALGIFQSSNFIGVVAGSVLAGLIALTFGWRIVFLVCGGAGVVFAAVVLVSLREPRRRRARSGTAIEHRSFWSAIRLLARQRGFPMLTVAFGVSGMSIGSLSAWAPAFLQRVHHLDIAQVGAAIGPAIGIGGVLGSIAWGTVAERMVKRTGLECSALLVPVIALPLAVPFFIAFLLVPTLSVALFCVGVGNFLMASTLGPCISVATGMSPPDERAFASNFLFIGQAVIGLALAPLIVGYLSDTLTAQLGAISLRWALVPAMATPAAAGLMLLLSFRAAKGTRRIPQPA
jgi:MFS family permease